MQFIKYENIVTDLNKIEQSQHVTIRK